MIDIAERLRNFIYNYGDLYDTVENRLWIDSLSEIKYRRLENEMLMDIMDNLAKDNIELVKQIDSVHGPLWEVLNSRGIGLESTQEQDVVSMIISLLEKVENENEVLREKVRTLQYNVSVPLWNREQEEPEMFDEMTGPMGVGHE